MSKTGHRSVMAFSSALLRQSITGGKGQCKVTARLEPGLNLPVSRSSSHGTQQTRSWCTNPKTHLLTCVDDTAALIDLSAGHTEEPSMVSVGSIFNFMFSTLIQQVGHQSVGLGAV